MTAKHPHCAASPRQHDCLAAQGFSLDGSFALELAGWIHE
jgi:hypothetical protein